MGLSDPAAAYESLDMPVPKTLNKPPPYGGKPKFVKFVPGDSGEFLPHIFYEGAYTCIKISLCSKLSVDPHTFKPSAGPLGEIHAWGLFPVSGIPCRIGLSNTNTYSMRLRMKK